MYKLFFKNPISLWLKWLINTATILLNNRGKSLRVGYMAELRSCSFSEFNTIAEKVSLTNVSMGFASYIARNSRLKEVEIGKFCSIGPNVMVNQGDHPSSVFVSTHPAFYSTDRQSGFTFTDQNLFHEYGPVKIGNDVWIGANVVIRSGVSIGNGSIIAAGAIVTKDVEPYAIVGGVPAKVLKYRFSEEDIRQIQNSNWWDWSFDKLRHESRNFQSIDRFLSS